MQPSQYTLTLKETRRLIGSPPTEEEKARQILKDLPMVKLKFLARKHNITLRSKKIEGMWEDRVVSPGKRQYANALAKVVPPNRIETELQEYKKPEAKKKRKRKSDDFWTW